MIEICRLERKTSKRTGGQYLRGLLGSMVVLGLPQEDGSIKIMLDFKGPFGPTRDTGSRNARERPARDRGADDEVLGRGWFAASKPRSNEEGEPTPRAPSKEMDDDIDF